MKRSVLWTRAMVSVLFTLVGPGACCFNAVGEPEPGDGGLLDGGLHHSGSPDAGTKPKCTIAGETFASRASNPEDGRQCCNPLKNPNGWSPWLVPGQPYSVGSGVAAGATGMVSDDFDGDGRPDLAVADFNDGAVSVLLQEPDGTFVLKRPDLKAGAQTNSLVARRLSPGSPPDLVATNSGDTTLSVFANQGGGLFAPQVSVVSGNSPVQCVVGSWSHGTVPDIICANLGEADAAVFLGSVDGGYALANKMQLRLSPWGVTAADILGTGALDLVFNQFNDSGALSILIDDRKGHFDPLPIVDGEASPYSVAVADFDGDGLNNLVVLHPNPSVLGASYLGYQRGNGYGAFGPSVNFPVRDSPEGLAVPDLNGDGWPDAVVTSLSDGAIEVFWNQGDQGGWGSNGDGGFSAPQSFPVGHPKRVLAADFNGDGAPDLAVSTDDGTIEVFINGCP